MWKRTSKKWRHRSGDSFVSLLISWLVILFRCLPPRAMISIAKFIGETIYLLQKKYRKRVIQNLSSAFGSEKGNGEIVKLARKVFFHFTLTPLETVYVYTNPLVRFLLKTEIKGKEISIWH